MNPDPSASPRDLDAFLAELMPRLGVMARDGFEDPGPVRFKTRGQPVTEIDAAIERVAREAILDTWPGHGIVGEEMGTREGSEDTTWYIDPIDGTMNFTRGIPFFAVSIGVSQGGRMVVGHVLDPLRGEHFRACAGAGARLGDRSLVLGGAPDLEHAVLSMQTAARNRFMTKPGFMAAMHRRLQKTRKFGTIALELAYLAAGRVDLLLAGKGSPQAWWDLAAGWALVEAAGGLFLDENGERVTPETTHLVAGSPDLVRGFLDFFHDWNGEDA